MTCTNVFFEDDGFCVRCGQVHKSAPKRKTVPTYESLRKDKAVKLPPKEEPAPTYEAPSVYTHLKGIGDPIAIIKGTIDLLNEVYEHNVGFRLGRGWASYCEIKSGTIQLGKKYLNWYADNAFLEYKTIKHVINFQELKGKDCYIQFALHEYAHYIQYLRGGLKWGSVHNQAFILAYRDVMKAVGVSH